VQSHTSRTKANAEAAGPSPQLATSKVNGSLQVTLSSLFLSKNSFRATQLAAVAKVA